MDNFVCFILPKLRYEVYYRIQAELALFLKVLTYMNSPISRAVGVVLAVFFVCLFLPWERALAMPSEVALHLKWQGDAALKRGETDRAISLYHRALEKNRDFANAYYNLATPHYLRKEYRKAAQSLETFVRLQPKDAEALYNLGCLKLRLGDFEGATTSFLKVEDCPCARWLAQKTKKALHFMKDLLRQSQSDQKLFRSLIAASEGAFSAF